MLLVSGIDGTLVAYFDFDAVAYYAVAASLVALIIGVQASLTSILIPAGAVLDARKDAPRLGQMLVSSTKYCMFFLLLTSLPLIWGGHKILSIWVGDLYATSSELLLQLLLIANIIRLSMAAYAALLIGTGQQKLALFSPIAEGVSNFIVSLIAGALFGAIGIAFGTLIGAIIGVICHFTISMSRTTGILVNRKKMVIEGFLLPILCTAPLFAIILSIPLFLGSGILVWFVWLLIAVILATIAFGYWGISITDRQRILSIFA